MKTQLVVHHSADPSERPQFDSVNAYHKSKGFPKSQLGYYGGYNWLIEKNGTVGQYRNTVERGAHTDARCDGGHCNDVALAVCFAGDLTRQQPTEAQLLAFHTLWGGLNQPKVLLHSDVKDTSCPGKFDFRGELERRRRSDLQQRVKDAIRAVPRVTAARARSLLRFVERATRLLRGG